MSTPLSTPIRQAKLGISSTKSLPLANEYKKLLAEQYQRLWLKHQQDLDLIDDIRSYVKSRLSIEREYTQSLNKLSRQHISHINKRFNLLQQCDNTEAASVACPVQVSGGGGRDGNGQPESADQASQRAARELMLSESEASDSRLQKRLANNGLDEPEIACTLYKVWSEHINRLQSSSKNRTDQFEQLTMVVDKLKDIRAHKATIGKKCLDSHLKRIQEDIIVSMVDVEKARKLYYEDESQAKKARENEEKIKKKRSGLLTKFTGGGDLQAKKEKTSAQREANDIQSTQARNDYIMALAAANAHLQHYYVKDLADFMGLIDDGVLDHCKIFMATLSECDINSLKDALQHAQYWSKMINLTGSQKTNSIFLQCDQSSCLRDHKSLAFEACNSDPISSISLDHNADYALQHEIDKWFTWFKKECRNLSQLIHQLERCQRALSEGQKSIELNGQMVEDLEPKIIELKQQIRKSEAAKLKAQARLKVIKEGGMQIEEWAVVESEIRADMARAQEELESRQLREVTARRSSSDEADLDDLAKVTGGNQAASGSAAANSSGNANLNSGNNTGIGTTNQQVLLQISKDSDASEMMDESMHNLASVSRSTSNLMDKQQKAISGYSALTDPALVWQDDYSGAWNTGGGSSAAPIDIKSPAANHRRQEDEQQAATKYDHLETSSNIHRGGTNNAANNTVQSSSPLSAIMDGNHGLSTSPYQIMGEAYKSDYECDYNRTTGANLNSAASSAEPYGGGAAIDHKRTAISEQQDETGENQQQQQLEDVSRMLNRLVIAQYTFDKTNEDDLGFVEGDVLRVIETSDVNWLQARNEATGEQGFIPAPYVRLLPPAPSEEQQQHQQEEEEPQIGTKYDSYMEDSNELKEEEEEEDANFRQPVYCRALYDYEPEANTYEQDGLPHLALVQGELLRVLDQGEEDGWWLVEKDDGSATKGHVPSMLVEELEDGDQGELDEDDAQAEDSGEPSECSDYPDLGAPPPALPIVEPPELDCEPQVASQAEVSLRQSSADEPVRPAQAGPATKEGGAIQSASSLVATSYIIIEPTPEVESRSITDDRPVGAADGGEQQPTAKGYSVVNEDFVLEGPARKPSQLNENNNYEPLSECDDSDIPAPPSVVIESFEVEKHDSSSSADEDDEQPHSGQDNQPTREIKHTGNVDVNPILRLRAEEFTKQIIAEAIAMTPNVRANSIREEDDNDDDENPHFEDHNGRDSLEDEQQVNDDPLSR